MEGEQQCNGDCGERSEGIDGVDERETIGQLREEGLRVMHRYDLDAFTFMITFTRKQQCV